MSKLDQILDLKTQELKSKLFNELSSFVNNVECFSANYEGKSYSFEVHVYKSGDGLKVMVECSRNIFLLRMFGKAQYFYIYKDGKVKDISGNEFEELPWEGAKNNQ
jgi:hypothetical protein